MSVMSFMPIKIIKFTAGFDCLFAFTQSRRDYLFPIQGPDNDTHLDIIYGFKVGWIINLYKSQNLIKTILFN